MLGDLYIQGWSGRLKKEIVLFSVWLKRTWGGNVPSRGVDKWPGWEMNTMLNNGRKEGGWRVVVEPDG